MSALARYISLIVALGLAAALFLPGLGVSSSLIPDIKAWIKSSEDIKLIVLGLLAVMIIAFTHDRKKEGMGSLVILLFVIIEGVALPNFSKNTIAALTSIGGEDPSDASLWAFLRLLFWLLAVLYALDKNASDTFKLILLGATFSALTLLVFPQTFTRATDNVSGFDSCMGEDKSFWDCISSATTHEGGGAKKPEYVKRTLTVAANGKVSASVLDCHVFTAQDGLVRTGITPEKVLFEGTPGTSFAFFTWRADGDGCKGTVWKFLVDNDIVKLA